MILPLRFVIISALICLTHLHINAETVKIPTKVIIDPTPDVTSDNFRCEKFREGGLSELKLKMLENCNLNLPFSNSLSLFAGEETFLYCCHKKSTN